MRYYTRHPLRHYGYLAAFFDFVSASLAIAAGYAISGESIGLAGVVPIACLAVTIVGILFYSSLYRLDRLLVRRRAALRGTISLALGMLAYSWAFPEGVSGAPAFSPTMTRPLVL